MGEQVACPECGEAQSDLWDYVWGQREEMVVACGSCGVDYTLVRRVSVSYEARRIEKKKVTVVSGGNGWLCGPDEVGHGIDKDPFARTWSGKISR